MGCLLAESRHNEAGVLSVLSVSPQRLWAKDTEGLPKRPFKPLILKGGKCGKVTINSKVLGVHVDTLEAA